MTNPTPQPDSPEDILTELENMVQRYVANLANGNHRQLQSPKRTHAIALTKLDEYYTNKFLEIVGEDEPASASVYKAHYRDNRPTDTLYSQTELQINNEIAKGRNQIRAELRQAIKQLSKKGE